MVNGPAAPPGVPPPSAWQPLKSVSAEFTSFMGVAVALAALVTPVIAWGVRRGGPLRLFFAGVTVPAAVFFFANRLG